MECLPLKNKRILLERVEKFISPVYFADVNLHSRLYPSKCQIDKIFHYSADGKETYQDVVQLMTQADQLADKGRKFLVSAARVGQAFGPTWSTHWFRVEFEIPLDWRGKEVRFRWNSSSEAMIWVDGQPVQGLSGDANQVRTDYILATKANGGESYLLYIEMAANGMFGAGKDGLINPPDADRKFELKMAELAVYSRATYEVLRDLSILIELAKELAEDDPRMWKALHVANDVVDCFQPETANSYERARSILDKIFTSNGSTSFTISAIGNCHIDSAWLWPYRETRRKCGRSWTSTVNLMKQYPSFTFAISQAQQLAWVKTDYPTLFHDIRTFEARGQCHIVGGTWVEMDGNLPSGESFVRQLLYGQRFFKKEFGHICNVFWLPDTFGYSAQLPQLMVGAGMKYFLTQKLSWNLINKFPHTTFHWEGIDGSRCLTHFPPAETYESDCRPRDVLKTATNDQEKGLSRQAMLLFGYGDGGGGPTREMIDRLERMDSLEGLPRIRFGSPEEFFKDVEKDRENRLNLWRGELYLELHQGTFTTHAKVKQRNRRCEFALRQAEFMSSFAWIETGHYETNEFDGTWKKLLLNQFHDVLPGTSIEMVYQDAHKLYSEICENTERIIDNCIKQHRLQDETCAKAVVNSFSWPRTEVIVVPRDDLEVPAKKMRNNAITQVCSDGTTLGIVSVPALSICKPVPLDSAGPLQISRNKETFLIENEFVVGAFDAVGRIISLKHKQSDREVISGFGNQLVLHDDIPLYWDAWDIMPYYERSRYVVGLKDVRKSYRVVEEGRVRVAVEVTLQIGSNSTLRQIISLDANSQYFKFKTMVDWHENRKLLRVEFPVDIISDQATFEIQFGHVKRHTHRNTSWDEAKFEVCGHKWIDLSEYDFGVSLLSDSKYGYSVFKNTMAMSLLRSPKSPDEYADMGYHEFSYAILPHSGSFQAAGVIQEAYNFNLPLTVLANLVPTGFFVESCFTLSNPAVVLETVKKAEDENALVLRMYESFGGRAKVTLTSAIEIDRIVRCDLLESPLSDKIEWCQDSGCHLLFTPFQVISLLVYPKHSV